MISMALTFPDNLLARIKADVDAQMEAVVHPRLREIANRELDKRVENPDSPQYKAQYTVVVDGVLHKDRSAIALARVSVRITFIQSAVRLAVAEMRNILSRAISADASESGYINREAIAQHTTIDIWYGGIGRRPRKLGGASEIENFLPDDFIALSATYGTQIFSNAASEGAANYMSKAARRIRAKLKLGKKTSILTVKAGRSQVVFDHLKPGYRRTGNTSRPVRLTRPHWGAWVIYIRYRQDQF